MDESVFSGLAHALEHSALAAAVNTSPIVLGVLSGAHLIGYVLTIGAAVVSNLRLGGSLLAERPIPEVARPARRLMLAGLSVSAVTGFLLFVPRANTALGNTFFQGKMTLLAAAIVVQSVIYMAVPPVNAHRRGWHRLAAGVSLTLWLGVVFSACAFILIE